MLTLAAPGAIRRHGPSARVGMPESRQSPNPHANLGTHHGVAEKQSSREAKENQKRNENPATSS
jgi:hypothetical protein